VVPRIGQGDARIALLKKSIEIVDQQTHGGIGWIKAYARHRGSRDLGRRGRRDRGRR
jgi:hypothetical protein